MKPGVAPLHACERSSSGMCHQGQHQHECDSGTQGSKKKKKKEPAVAMATHAKRPALVSLVRPALVSPVRPARETKQGHARTNAWLGSCEGGALPVIMTITGPREAHDHLQLEPLSAGATSSKIHNPGKTHCGWPTT